MDPESCMPESLNKRNNPAAIAVMILVLLAATLACGFGGGSGSSNDVEATANALAQSISLTATAGAGENPDAGSQDVVGTAQANATQQAQAIQATADALSNLSEQEIEATRQAFAPILAELPKYDVDPDKGRPAWIHPPVTIDLEGYMSFDYANQYLGTVAADFVMSSEITWNTQFGTSGCGFALRNNGNEEAFDQYIVAATRGGSGRVAFILMAGGEILNTKDFYAYGIDNTFNFRNDTTNRLTVVMRGPVVQIYTNDTLISEFDVNDPPRQPFIPPAPTPPPDADTNPEAAAAYELAKDEYNQIVGQINAEFRSRQEAFRETDVEFEKGFVAMVALSESGRTQCSFNNTWLFLIED